MLYNLHVYNFYLSVIPQSGWGEKKHTLIQTKTTKLGLAPNSPVATILHICSSCLICRHRCNTHTCLELPIWKVEPTAAQLLCKVAQGCGLRVRAGVGAMKGVKAECGLSYIMFTMDGSFSESRKAWMGSGLGGTGGRQRCCPKPSYIHFQPLCQPNG